VEAVACGLTAGCVAAAGGRALVEPAWRAMDKKKAPGQALCFWSSGSGGDC